MRLPRHLRVTVLPAAIGVLMSLAAAASISSVQTQGKVLVVGPVESAGYQEAIGGIVDRFQGNGVSCAVVNLQDKEFAAVLQDELGRSPRLIVAVGSDAVGTLSQRNPSVPLVSAMTAGSAVIRLSAPQSAAAPAAGTYLNVTAGAVMKRIPQVFPGVRKIGVIRRPGGPGPGKADILGEAAKLGISVEIADCPGPNKLVEALLALRSRQVEFVLCLPDGELYNAATVKPFILASLENRLPVIGFSASFVKAGAAFGVYPDLRALGRQTAEVGLRLLSGDRKAAFEEPRELEVAVNQRVVRLLGLPFKEKESSGVVVFR